MKPGDLVLVYQHTAAGVRLNRLEGVGTLERLLTADQHGDGRERWSVRFPDGDARSRTVFPADVVEDPAELENVLAARGHR